jgi:hypothetical protein
MMEGIRPSETSVLTRAKRRDNPEGGNLHLVTSLISVTKGQRSD